MTISPLLTFNLKVGFTFSVLSPKACPYVVMRFAPSLIVAVMNHRILSRLTQIQREDYLWEFVVVCGWKKSLQQNICVIRGICGF